MVFGINLGSSSEKSKNESQYTNDSQSSSANNAWNWANSFGNNQSNSFGTNQSQSGSFIDQTQGGFLNNLWQNASNYANPDNTDARAQEILGELMPGLQNTFSNLQGMTDPSAVIGQQADALKQGLGSLFRNEINPTIEGNAIASGGFGGGRQGVAQGVAAGQLGDTFTSGLADITSAANANALNASNALGTLGNNIFNMGTATPGMDILSQLSGILGGPTVLQNSQSTGQTGSTATGTTGSSSAGGSTGSSQSTTTGQGTSSGSGSSSKWDLGF